MMTGASTRSSWLTAPAIKRGTTRRPVDGTYPRESPVRRTGARPFIGRRRSSPRLLHICYLLVEKPSELLRAARRAAGLSASALAAKAQVPTSTVTRIEKGATDPTFGMLARLLDAAGHQLIASTRARDDAPMTLASLANAATLDKDRLRIDWTRLRAFADWADRHPREVPVAIADPPLRTGTVLDAILAAFAEKLADRAGIDPPRWTRSVPAPREPWAPPGTPAMRARAAAATPDAFRRRNIVLSRDAIFRDAA